VKKKKSLQKLAWS